jgi:GLPGLI family protein
MFKLMGAEYEEAGQTADNELASGKSGYQSHLYFGKNRAFGEGESAPMPQPMQAIAQDLPQVYTLQDKQANEYHMLYEDKESPYRTSQPLINKGKLEKLPGEKTILGYSCRQARWTPDNSASSYLIWYAPELPAGFSPVGYLPVEGLVLEVKDQFVEITAVDMEAGSWPEAMKNFSQYELISSSELAKRMFKTMQATPAMQKLIEEAQKLKENDE